VSTAKQPDCAADPAPTSNYERWIRAKIDNSRADPRPAFSDAQWQRIRADKVALLQTLRLENAA